MKNYHSAASCFLQELNLSLKLFFFQLEKYIETFTHTHKKKANGRELMQIYAMKKMGHKCRVIWTFCSAQSTTIQNNS